ncbi:MAG: ribulose-phosphate 3-epimerase [Clostridiales bacterium]|nr:MAG: ribulose-phosphate 3-epimerase [Clostridiales bacterium]
MAELSPSILSANFARLEEEMIMLEKAGLKWVHIDVMDGIFVPNITFGPVVIKDIRKVSNLFFDVHLMIEDPVRYAEEFKKVGADLFTMHYEACTHLHRAIQKVKSLGMKAGVSLNPHTPVSNLKHVINDIDVVLIMSVNPGFGGQKFIEEGIEKVKELKALINEKGANTIIEVDGGVCHENARALIDAGADVLVAGSAVFNAKDPVKSIEKFMEIMNA